MLLLSPDEVDWIETQGNYLALHVGSKVHLVRDTLARFEGELDFRRFVRASIDEQSCRLTACGRSRLYPTGTPLCA